MTSPGKLTWRNYEWCLRFVVPFMEPTVAGRQPSDTEVRANEARLKALVVKADDPAPVAP